MAAVRTTEASTRTAHIEDAAMDHAQRLILHVCQIAGSRRFIANARSRLKTEGVRKAVAEHNSAVLFDWLMAELSYQGIADQVAADFMERHGHASCEVMAADLRQPVSCPKLRSYWHFQNCRYNKTRYTCAEPDHLPRCPLPRQWLRNGRLNQTGYSLYLFIRDVAGGDLVGWIDQRLRAAAAQPGADPLASMRAAVIDPLREIYGVSDKVLMMALSQLLLGVPGQHRRWVDVGGSMIAVDTLVHNFLHRTGILQRFSAKHPYGIACYRPGGCAEIIETIAHRIDARQFNRRYPAAFPRFVQHAIWRYCAQQGLAICNGNTIDDRERCDNKACALYSICDRIVLNSD